MFWIPLLTLVFGALAHPSQHHDDSHHKDCSYTAPGSTYILLSNFTYFDEVIYSTPAHMAVAYGTVSFDYYNSPVEGIAKCTATSSQPYAFFSENTVYSCTAPSSNVNATFTFHGPAGTLGVNETWSCGGNQYLGYATTSANLDCQHNSWTNPNFTWPNNGEMYSITNTTCKPAEIHLFDTIVKLGGHHYC